MPYPKIALKRICEDEIKKQRNNERQMNETLGQTNLARPMVMSKTPTSMPADFWVDEEGWLWNLIPHTRASPWDPAVRFWAQWKNDMTRHITFWKFQGESYILNVQTAVVRFCSVFWIVSFFVDRFKVLRCMLKIQFAFRRFKLYWFCLILIFLDRFMVYHCMLKIQVAATFSACNPNHANWGL